MKKEASSGEKKSGSQPANNSLASFRYQRKTRNYKDKTKTIFNKEK